MRRNFIGLVVLLACCFALPPLNNQVQLVEKMGDAPSLVPKPGVPSPDQDGVIVEQVVNVNKTAVIVVLSEATPAGQKQRQLIRDTWLQALNKTSPYAVPRELRKAFAVWFAVPKIAGAMESVEKEGNINGDILEINPSDNSETVSKTFDLYGALARWVRVAYFEHFDYLVLTKDTSFLSITNLNNYLATFAGRELVYTGFVNSFESAPESYGQNYYAPFVVEGTIVLSRAIVELFSRELNLIKPLARADITLGSFLMTYDQGKPIHNGNFVSNLGNLYEPLEHPIIINRCPAPMMIALSLPGLDVNGHPLPPSPVPAQVNSISTRQIYVDPIPKDPQPECGGLNPTGCSLDAMKLINQVPK